MLNKTGSRAFTLVELLVVIAIVAVLVSMLVPALAKSRESARKVQCQSNLRSMYLGWVGYGADHKEQPPIIWNTQNSFPQRKLWHESLLKYIVGDDSMIIRGNYTEMATVADPNRNKYPAHQPIFRCPSTYGPHTGVPWDANAGRYFWICYFANNFWGTDKYGVSSSAGNWYYGTVGPTISRPVREWNSYRQDRNGGRTIIIGETSQSWISSHTGSSYYYDGSPALARDRYTLHGGPNNALLGDGSVISKVNTLASVYPWHTQTH